MKRFHPIGTPGEPWSDAERRQWRQAREVRRPVAPIHERIRGVSAPFCFVQYGSLAQDPARYPLFCVQPKEARLDAPWALITGGVHGYETSGVHGALAFLEGAAAAYLDRLNIVVVPCVSPWGYEVVHRWNADAHDPNRSFVDASPVPEAALLMEHISSLGVSFQMHIDLHETTDSDETEFRPALAARDGKAHTPGHIPDGFYTVADSANPEPAFQRAIIEGVAKVTHIADADAKGQIIGADVTQRGVIHYDAAPLGLCMAMTDARFRTTTEVYPDGRATPEECNRAQVAAVVAGLEHLLAQ